MSLRRFVLFGWIACAPACFEGGVDGNTPSAPDAPVSTRMLVIEGDMQVSVVAGTTQALRVRLVGGDGEAIEGEAVAFGLWGTAEGASLLSAEATTDADGIAEATLMAGRTESQFQVRASADGVDPVFFDIDVRNAEPPHLTVEVRYDGERPIASRNVAVVADIDCDKLLANSGDVKVAYALNQDDPGLRLKDALGAGRQYAVAAWGSDDGNSKLASGCTNFTAPVTGDADEADVTLDVVLSDLPFTVADRYDVTLSVDVGPMLMALTANAESAVRAKLTPSATPGASFLLDLLPTSTELSAARAGGDLDAKLQAALDESATGPLQFADALSAALLQEGDGVSLEGQLVTAQGDQSSALAVDEIVATHNGETLLALDSKAVPLSGPIVLDARYDDARAAFAVDTCTVPLGYGSYAAWLLDRVQASADAYASALGQSGCAQLAQLVDAESMALAPLTGDQARTACQDGMKTLVTALRAALVELDATHDALRLSGSVIAHDRNGDRQVDDLGPSTLSGHWATEGAADAESEVNATLRVTPLPVLTI